MVQNDPVTQQILDQVDLIDLVGQYVRLQKHGKEYRGLCPFHSEKTPSFYVAPERGLYHCFGCKAGGTAFDFIMAMENLTFSEAISFLAERLNLTLPERSPRQRKQDGIDRYQVMEKAALLYQRWLHENQTAQKYLLQRGLTPEQIKHFSLGCAPPGWENLRNALLRQGVPQEVMAELGLIVQRKSGGSYYDRFRNRIMFPIRNTLGRVVAFGGRALDPEDNAKYLNSNDTSLFNKSRVLYLLDQAKQAMKDSGAIVVEGYMDAIAMHAAGFLQTVAVLGTALTGEHVKLLRRYTDDVTLLYDGDGAGQTAAKRSVETFFGQGLTPKVILLPEGQDPDDYIKTHGAEGMRELIRSASDGFDYYYTLAAQPHDPATPSGKMAVIEDLLPLLAQLPNQLLLHDYIQRISGKLGAPMDELKATIQQRLPKVRKQAEAQAARLQHAGGTPTPQQSTPHAPLKESLIRLLAFHQGLVLPGGMALNQKSNLFSEDQLREAIPKNLSSIKDESIYDRLLDVLLNDVKNTDRQHPPGDRRSAWHLETLLPDAAQRARFIEIIEREPLPSTEKQLRKLRDEVMQHLEMQARKHSFEEFKRQGDLEALNELLWSKDISADQSSFF